MCLNSVTLKSVTSHNWGFQQIVGSRFSEAKNLVIFCRCLVEFAGIASCFFVMGYLLLCFFIKPGSMIEQLGELLGPKYSSMEHGEVSNGQSTSLNKSGELPRAQTLVSRAHLLLSQMLGELQMGPSISWQVLQGNDWNLSHSGVHTNLIVEGRSTWNISPTRNCISRKFLIPYARYSSPVEDSK